MYLHETSRTVGIFHLPALVFEIWAFTFAKMEVGHPVLSCLKVFPNPKFSLEIVSQTPKWSFEDQFKGIPEENV